MPQVDTERLWQLTALARTNLKAAGTKLHALVQHVTPELPQLRVLVGYYSAINDRDQLDKAARRIVKMENKQIDRIKKLVEEAIKDSDQTRAMSLLKQMDVYHPEENYNLNFLRNKVKKLQKGSQDKAA